MQLKRSYDHNLALPLKFKGKNAVSFFPSLLMFAALCICACSWCTNTLITFVELLSFEKLQFLIQRKEYIAILRLIQCNHNKAGNIFFLSHDLRYIP